MAMRFLVGVLSGVILLLAVSARCPCVTHAAAWQDDEEEQVKQKREQQEKPKQEGDKKGAEGNPQDEEPLIELTPGEKVELGPREIRLTLWDGSVVRGNLGFSTLHVQTKFGRLEIPVENIVTFRPGLNSLPGINRKVTELIEKLGDKEFKVREKAKLELLGMGPQILKQLQAASDGNSAERKKNLQAVIEVIAEQQGDQDADATSAVPVLGMEDTITTASFTIVGQVEEKQYELTTRYGILNVRLEDIQAADRTWGSTGETIEKKVEIAADAFFQRSPVSTRIRVNAGDRITIKAEGSVNWASWGNIVSDPDGIASHGMWNSFNCGMVVARIGKGNDYYGVGRKASFVAKSSGELFLGVAMQDNFANQRGYQWTGSYKATVRIESSGNQ